ncbi:MAG: hypothetical protein KKD05_00015 [Candidatus Omnitrophica bacterium]|nr:hypothetical protein [Candidatus Omnitrophota bacterium]
MRFKIKHFYSCSGDFQRFYFRLKQTPCPYCKSAGSLILHGYLSGNHQTISGEKIIRGRRIFCSNRNRRVGCGKTFSLLAANILKGFNICANSLWRFLNNISKGMSKIQALKKLNLPFSDSTVYRLFKIFSHRQSRIRTLLLRQSPVPQLPFINHPPIQTIVHLKSAFKNFPCPITAFQLSFQTPFL